MSLTSPHGCGECWPSVSHSTTFGAHFPGAYPGIGSQIRRRKNKLIPEKHYFFWNIKASCCFCSLRAPLLSVPNVAGTPHPWELGKMLHPFSPPPPPSQLQPAALPLGFSTLDLLPGISGSIRWCKQIVFIMIILGLTSWPCITKIMGFFLRIACRERPCFPSVHPFSLIYLLSYHRSSLERPSVPCEPSLPSPGLV